MQSGKILAHRQVTVTWHGSDQALALVDRLLQSHRQPLKRVIVVRGPGPFTAVRTGIIIANTLSYARNIPVVGSTSAIPLTDQRVLALTARPAPKTHRLVRPFYGKAPNITKPKPRQAARAKC